MTAATATATKPKPKRKRKFYMLIPKEIEFYRDNGMPAWIYIDFWLRLQNPHLDRVLRLTPKEISEATGVKLQNVYAALKRLRDLKRIKIEKPDRITVLPTNEEILLSLEKQRQKQRQKQSSKVIEFPKKKKNNSSESKKTEAETVGTSATQDPSDYQTFQTRKKEEEFLSLELEDFWLEEQDTSKAVDALRQDLQNIMVEKENQQESSQTVDAEIIETQPETVPTSDNNQTTAVLAKQNYPEVEECPARTTQSTIKETRWLKRRKPGQPVENFLEDRPWLNDRGQLKRELVEWLANRYVKAESFKDVNNLADAMTIARNHLLNTIRDEEIDGYPSEKLCGYWEDYQFYLKRWVNNGVDRERVGLLSDEEKQQLALKAVDLACKSNPENNPVAPKREIGVNNQKGFALLNNQHEDQKNASDIINTTDEQKLNLKRDSIVSRDREQTNSNPVPTDEHGAISVQSYAPWQPKQQDEPQATKEQWDALKAKLAKFQKSFVDVLPSR